MAAERISDDFGATLRDARERRGVSLRQIASDTKISVAVLEALERNDISRLPGGIFGRSFIRSYATAVGLDPDVALEDFLRQFPHESATGGAQRASHLDPEDTFEADRRTASVVLTLLGLSIPIGALVIYLGLRGHGHTATVSSPPTPASVATQGDHAQATADRAEPLRVEVVAIQSVRLSITADGAAPLEVQLEPGDRHGLDVRRDLLLTVADPGSIEWTINGMPARPLGPAGSPATVHLTPESYQPFMDLR